MRRIVILLAALLVTIMLLPGVAHAQTGAIRISVDVGFDGHFRSGQWTPLLIRISNDGPGVSGSLRVTSGGALRLTSGGYATPVELPTQSSKQIFLYVALEIYTQQVQVDLVTNDGSILQSATVNASRAGDNNILLALVTESPTGAVDLSNARLNTDAIQANIDLDNIPTLAQGLDSLDVLVFTDVDTGKLALDRRQAVQNWVLGGGHLIVAGGPNWQKTRIAFESMLPMTASGTTTLSVFDRLAAFTGYGSDPLNASGTILTQGTTLPDARILVEQDNVPLVIRRDYGIGTVDYVAFDPGLEPFRSWTHRGDFWMNLLGTVVTHPGWSQGVMDVAEAQRAINSTRGLRLPDVAQLALLLGLYILLIGPLNYLVLRQIRRPEWAWFTIPIIILGTSVVAYMVGSSLRGTLPTVSRLNIIQQWAEQDTARLDGLGGVLSPRRASYDVVADDGLAVRPLPSNDNAANILIDQGIRFSASAIPVDSGLSASFVESTYVPAIPLQGTATLAFDSPTQLTVTGEFSNLSSVPLTDVIALCVNTAIPLGDIDAGETKKFTFAVETPDFSSPSMVNGLINPSLYISRFNPYRGGLRDLTPADILVSGHPASKTRVETIVEQNERRRREHFAAAMSNDNERGSGRGFAVYIAGWAATTPKGISLKNTTSNTEDVSLYVTRLNTRLTATGSVKLPAGYTVWSPLEKSTTRDYTPYGLYVIGNDIARFRFALQEPFRLKTITEITLNIQRDSNSSTGIIGLMDWRSGTWVDLPELGQSSNSVPITDPNDLTRFVAPDGTVRVQVRAPNSAVSYIRVDVAYSGILTDSR